jgi:hypothetical protein
VTITPTVAAAIAGSDRTICKNTTTTLGSASNTTGAGITYAWTPASGLSSTTSTTPVFTPSAAGKFTFTLTRTQSGCSTSSKVTVTVIDFVLPAMTSPTICQNSCVDIGTTTQTGVQYFWSPATGLSDATISNPTACLTTSGMNYQMTAVDLNGCVAISNVFVAVNASPAPQITIAPQTVCLSATNVKLNPTVTPVATYTYQWSPTASVSDIYAANPEIYIMGGGIVSYTVTVTNTATGCANIGTGVLSIEQCPICVTPAAPVLSVSNNITCPTIINGSINVQTACGAGTHIEYSTNSGTTWSTTKPSYTTTPITIIARCVKDIDDTCISLNSTSVTTAPTILATITNPSASQSVCVSATGTNITVQSSRNTTNSIKFVKFTSDQMAGATPTSIEAAAIYAGTSISTVTPTGASAPYTATYIWNGTDFPNATNTTIAYYVYAIAEPDGGAGCRPLQEIQIMVSPTVTAGTGTNPATICQGGSGLTTMDLFGQLTSENTGGAWSQTMGSVVSAALNTSTGVFNPNGIATGTYVFRYTVTGIAPCPNDTEDITVTIQQCCPQKLCLPITVVRN